MPIELQALGLTELIRLRERLTEALAQRYEKQLAIAVVEGPTREVTSFPTVDAAVAELMELMRRAPSSKNGLHFARVLTNGKRFAGETLAVCEAVAASGQAGELRLTRPAYVELSSRFRLRCSPAPELAVAAGPALELMLLDWREQRSTPAAVRVAETGAQIALPDKNVITIGRLPENDVVISLADPASLQRISRLRHAELRREGDDLYLHPLSEQPTEVDGQKVAKGERARVMAGTVARLAGVVTLTFATTGAAGDEAHLETVGVSRPRS